MPALQTVGVHANNCVEVDITGLSLTHKQFPLVMGALACLPVQSINLEEGAFYCTYKRSRIYNACVLCAALAL